MWKSLQAKLVFIMLLIITLLMIVVGAFLVRGVQSFYLEEFYNQMEDVFSDEEFYSELSAAALSDDAEQTLQDILSAYSGRLGVDSGSRNYYILNGSTGELILSSEQDLDTFEITPNILSAISSGSGSDSHLYSSYMDLALRLSAEDSNYIIYIKDNKQTVQELSSEIIKIIIEALLIGLIIAVFLCLLLAKTLVVPIQELTKAAEHVASGDFSNKIPVDEKDEIGILAETFNNMANQLEQNIDELQHSEVLRQEFVANVSHELRTPITSIKTYTETLIESENLPKEIENNFLHVILNESDRMTKIVQDLLELSKFDAGKIKISFEKFDITQSVTDVYNAVLLDAQKHGHTINLEIDENIPEIYGDKSRVEQVIMNVLTNAVKYTPDGGTICVSSKSDGNSVYISVTDNGIGIPKDDIPRIFDRFYRVDKARSRETGGTGLGLSIAQEIISRHGGRFDVESEVGEGTKITIILPLKQTRQTDNEGYGPENEEMPQN